MSYIRCGSNPEGLYIFGGLKGIEVYTDRASKKDISWTIPFRHFKEVCKRWDEAFDEDEGVKYGDFSCKCVWVNSDFEEKEVKEVSEHFEKVFKQAIEAKPTVGLQLENKVKLTWKGESIYLWDVTWLVVVQRVVRDINFPD